jgi:succinate dehydrogenase / fumarate reductase flavoprotein subunit
MERYAPNLKDLASRDVVSRSMDQDQGRPWHRAARGSRAELDHLGPEVIMKRLPSIREIALKFANVDPIGADSVVPTIHYRWAACRPASMARWWRRRAAIPTRSSRLYDQGCTCVSVHGANRLGTNSCSTSSCSDGRPAIHRRQALASKYVAAARCVGAPARAARSARRPSSGESVHDVAHTLPGRCRRIAAYSATRNC